MTHSGNRSSKTFKPKKNIPEGSHQYELLKHAEATLGSGNLRMAVMLPEGEDLNEWVAVNSKHQVYLSRLPRATRVHIPGRMIHSCAYSHVTYFSSILFRILQYFCLCSGPEVFYQLRERAIRVSDLGILSKDPEQ